MWSCEDVPMRPTVRFLILRRVLGVLKGLKPDDKDVEIAVPELDSC
jgi:hypothetical protein